MLAVHSPTRLWAVPGLRGGYVVGPAGVLARLRAARQAWAVNSPVWTRPSPASRRIRAPGCGPGSSPRGATCPAQAETCHHASAVTTSRGPAVPFYAEFPARRFRQVIGDLVAVAFLALSVWIALQVRELVLTLRSPGERLVDAGSRLQGTFDGAAESAGRIPGFGDALADGLGRGSSAGETLVSAGEAQVAFVEGLATWVAVLVVVGPLLVVLLGWLPWRVQYLRRSGVVRRLAVSGQHDLLALRALTRLPPRRLAAVSGPGVDPAAGWRRGDPHLVRVLAAEELRSHGLRP